MNKIIIYLAIAIIFASNCLALGIGARNEQIFAEGQKTIELFIINDRNLGITVNLGILGSNEEGVSLEKSKLEIASGTYITKFKVNLDFDKIKKQDIKIVASESSENNGQISATANAVYKLPIIWEKVEIQETSLDETRKDLQEFSGNEKAVDLLPEKNDEISIQKQISGAASKEKEVEMPTLDFELKSDDTRILFLFGVAIAVVVVLFEIVFARRKTPLEKYITKTRKIGKSDEEIRGKLKNAGWNDLLVDEMMKKK